MQRWLEQPDHQCQLVDIRPSSCSELYYVLAELADRTPAPRNQLESACARYLMQSACMGMAARVLGDFFSRVDVSLGWASVWAALKLIDGEQWPQLADELRALAVRSQKVQPLPQRVESYLRVHFAQACRLPDIARDVGASLRVITEAFKREFRCTVHQYLCLLRLRAAVRLLTESDMKITAICESVGWNSQADFYRHLRRFTTLRPGVIRVDKSCASMVLQTLDQWLASHGLAA